MADLVSPVKFARFLPFLVVFNFNYCLKPSYFDEFTHV